MRYLLFGAAGLVGLVLGPLQDNHERPLHLEEAIPLQIVRADYRHFVSQVEPDRSLYLVKEERGRCSYISEFRRSKDGSPSLDEISYEQLHSWRCDGNGNKVRLQAWQRDSGGLPDLFLIRRETDHGSYHERNVMLILRYSDRFVKVKTLNPEKEYNGQALADVSRTTRIRHHRAEYEDFSDLEFEDVEVSGWRSYRPEVFGRFFISLGLAMEAQDAFASGRRLPSYEAFRTIEAAVLPAMAKMQDSVIAGLE
ncbi:hypothetical protein COV20_02900 [Candidatus Woesearchaeota archaeon CG10_big_fil_rev_8_21_14_0_10_45_16]|nr:MAG: hypothetical protein COV20_02900 [Candidatus Woesearchaeota archaeon CG10_big_fil_rev_8_21_14_0_10_45_16]